MSDINIASEQMESFMNENLRAPIDDTTVNPNQGPVMATPTAFLTAAAREAGKQAIRTIVA